MGQSQDWRGAIAWASTASFCPSLLNGSLAHSRRCSGETTPTDHTARKSVPTAGCLREGRRQWAEAGHASRSHSGVPAPGKNKGAGGRDGGLQGRRGIGDLAGPGRRAGLQRSPVAAGRSSRSRGCARSTPRPDSEDAVRAGPAGARSDKKTAKHRRPRSRK